MEGRPWPSSWITPSCPHDPQASAQFLAGILGLPVDPPVAHFIPVTLANGVSLDFLQRDDVNLHLMEILTPVNGETA